MLIEWTEGAQKNLEAILEYVQSCEEDVLLAQSVVRRILAAVERLTTFPLAAREGRCENTRELVVRDLPYIVVYRVGKTVQILRVIHTSRELQ